MSNRSAEANGGAGAGYHARIIVTEAGYYVLSSGKGGYSIYAGTGGRGEAGTATTISKDGVVKLSVGGGSPANTWDGGGSAGAGGKITVNDFQTTEVYVSTAGADGRTAGKGGTATAPAGPISGHTWGKAGNSYAHYAGGAVDGGYHGYLMLKYIGSAPNSYLVTINSLTEGATVVLTVNGVDYNQNSMIVFSGTTVSWTVSKSGYQTATGSATVTNADITENVTLEPQVNPLFYCYKWSYSGTKWLYFPNELSSVGQVEPMYFIGDGSTKATSASQLGTSLYNVTVQSVSGNSVTAVDDSSWAIRYDMVRSSENDLYS